MILATEEMIREYTEKGCWRKKETLLDDFRLNVRWFPGRTALVDPANKEVLVGLKPERITYRELGRAVDAVATALVEMGIKKNDVVLVQLPNCWELAMLYLAIGRAGAISSPVPVQWRQKEIGYIASVTEAKAFITLKEFNRFRHLEMAEELKNTLPGLEHVIPLEDIKRMAIGQADTKRLDRIEIDPNDIFFIEWTSGTEAEPKGCPISHNNWYALSNMFLVLYECRMGDVILLPAPCVNMSATVAYLPWIRIAGTLVLHHPFDGEVFIRQIIEEKVNFTGMVPAMLIMMLKHPRVNEFDFSSVRVMLTGSAPPPPFAIQEYYKRWGIEIINNWGQNEGTNLTSGAVTGSLEDRISFPQFGKKNAKWPFETFFKGIETKIVDTETGKELSSPGQVGELLYKSPSVMACYFKQPEMTKSAFEPDGFFHTGDLFQLREGNAFSYFDRKKDIIIRGGFNISAQEIENMVVSHPKVAEAAAVAMSDEMLGEKVCIFVVPVAGETVTLEEITRFVREKGVAVYKLPERMEMIDALPRNPVGKILKRELRNILEEKITKEKEIRQKGAIEHDKGLGLEHPQAYRQSESWKDPEEYRLSLPK